MTKQILAYYLLKSPSNGDGHLLAYLFLEVIMDKFNILASPYCRNFVLGCKHFVSNGMGMMGSLMVFNVHYGLNISIVLHS